jgi:hypothetical protein
MAGSRNTSDPQQTVRRGVCQLQRETELGQLPIRWGARLRLDLGLPAGELPAVVVGVAGRTVGVGRAGDPAGPRGCLVERPRVGRQIGGSLGVAEIRQPMRLIVGVGRGRHDIRAGGLSAEKTDLSDLSLLTP